MSQAAIKDARSLFHSRSFGVLSTISAHVKGYPFGSVVPYCADGGNRATILISTIAQHTKNIKADPRCSLTTMPENDDVQANSRLCIIGDMEKLPEGNDHVIERYYRHFPQSKGYHEAHDFSFYRLRPVQIRYIGGFGNINWLSPADFDLENPFDGEPETYITDHMNHDHREDLIAYCQYYKGLNVSEEQIRMAGIDAHGFDVFIADKKVRFDFDSPVNNAGEARAALVAMSKKAKS